MSLFVPEEDDDEKLHGVTVERSTTEDISEAEVDQESESEPEDPDDQDDDQDEEDDDEIVSEIPIHLSSKISGLSVLQYPNKGRQVQVVSSRLKKDSGLIELEVPLDTSRFFDTDKSGEWGAVRTQVLQGVMSKNDIYYVGTVSEGAITLTPLSSTVQLRPSLKYIDESALSKRQKQQALQKVDDNKTKEVKMIQMSVKSSSEAAQQRLSGALAASKKLGEEFYVNYNWRPAAENRELAQKLVHDADDEVLVSSTTEKDYINWLFSETRVG